MGCAVQSAKVFVRDEDETISGVNGALAPARPATPTPAEASDYPELVTVERRHYAVHGEIAKGGMGRVLDARDLRLGRAVAIKELLPKARAAARRFEREARITARLQHPAIIHIYEAGVWPGGEPFYAMTKVTGRSLAPVVAERTTLAERIGLLPNVIAVADALAYAHSQDVIHRDLKPANVLVGGFGETVVIDWGLAKDLAAPGDPAASLDLRIRSPEQTLDGSVVGTPTYMPPEQARGEPVDHRADVYALGALLYKVLSGKPPYEKSQDVLQDVLNGPPIPIDEHEPNAPADLVAIVKKAMAREPQDRYPTASELAADLKRFETGQLVAARHYTRRQLLARWLRRHRVAVTLAAITIALVSILASVSVGKIITERDRAETEQRKDERRRQALLEERGRAELLAGRAGPALAYFAGAIDGKPDDVLDFMIAEAMRPFQAQLAPVTADARIVDKLQPRDVLVAYRPDDRFATASIDGVITLWDKSGTNPRELDHGHGRPRAIVWSPDGKFLAVGGEDKVLRIWDDRGVFLYPLEGHTGTINDISFSPKNHRVVTASSDDTARIWDLDTRQGIEITRYGSPVTVAQFSPNGTQVVTGAESGEARVWSDIDDESLLRAHDKAIRAARWSPDGALVVTASADGTARVWDPVAGKPIAREMRHQGDVEIDDAEWSSDSRHVITAGRDHYARLWTVPEPPGDGQLPEVPREIAHFLHGDEVTAARFSVDDLRIITASHDRTARVWDRKGQLLAMFEHGDAVTSFELSRDGDYLVTGSRDGIATLWSLGITQSQVELKGSPIRALAISSAGQVAAGTDDGRLWRWPAREHDPDPTSASKHNGAIFAVAFSPDGRQLVTAGEDHNVYVWDAAGAEPEIVMPVGADPITAIAFGAVIAAGDEHKLWIWSTDGKLIASPDSDAPVTAIAIHPSGAILVATAKGVSVYDAHGKRLGEPFAIAAPVRSLAFDVSGKRLAIGGRIETVITKFENLAPSEPRLLDSSSGDSDALVFNRNGTLLFTGGTDGVTRVWDAEKGKLLATRETGGGAVHALALGDDQWLWTGNADGIARALDVHVRTDAAGLRDFLARRVPWQLGDDDVVRRKTK